MTLVRTDGPVVVVPAAVADLVAPALRSWLREVEARIGRDQRGSLRDVAEVVEELEEAAAVYRHAMSPDGSPRRHFRAGEVDPGDGDVVCTVEEAAKALSLSTRQVQRLVAGGTLRATRPARDLLVERASVNAELARRRAS